MRKALCRQLLLSYGTEQALRVARRTHESSKKFSQCWEYLFTLVYIESMEKQGGSRNMNLSADEYEVIKELTLLKTHDVLADIIAHGRLYVTFTETIHVTVSRSFIIH